jgi:hypothetical protein
MKDNNEQQWVAPSKDSGEVDVAFPPDDTRFDHLSVEETKKMITPHAFTVDSSLFGIMLATPFQRGVAIGIDALFIGILAKQDIAFLAIVAAATFFKVGRDKKQVSRWRKTRKMFRLLSIVKRQNKGHLRGMFCLVA